jgi:hypothetical protein
MTVGAVMVNGAPARFTFVQPAYPGDPHGPGDPNPLAHEAGQRDPVGGPGHNPLPACSPELTTTDPAALSAAQQQKNRAIMNKQEDITNFQSLFNGTYPFTPGGVVAGIPSAGFEEEMQTMITFSGGQVGLGTLNHENMHQWRGQCL